jgi:DNA mismatch repair protein MutL
MVPGPVVHDSGMSRIRVLPEELASRIAAGEVVERPASVVKELVENSLDAGARHVEVVLENGGRKLVRIVDDGCGMDRDDALLAFEQHATSKIPTDSDLSEIPTFGFRGEALAAIGSCARVTLVTAEADGEGTKVVFENGKMRDVQATGAPRGTSLEVRGLFSALPARRKFLRSAATELSHVVKFLEQQALALPEVHFSLEQDRKILDLFPVEDASERVGQLLGAEFLDQALHLDGERDELSVEAWLVRSGTGTGRVNQLSFLVNGRVVSDRMLSHAVREAGQKLFGIDKTPAGVVVLTLPPSEVDVNVHPAKREVRFSRSWEVHDGVRDLLRAESFRQGAFGPAVDRADGEGRLAVTTPAPAGDVPPPGPSPWLHEPSQAAEPAAPRQWEGQRLPGTIDPSGAKPYQAASPATGLGSGRRILGQHRNTYVLVEDEQGLVVVDQHCAHERVLFEQVMGQLDEGVARQALLEPVVVELPRRLLPVLEERREDLLKLGFEVELFGDAAVAVRAVPSAAGSADPAELVRELAAQEIPASSQVARVDRLAATIACKAAVKAGFPLGAERMRWLVDQLYEAEVPTTCPHGRVALLRLSDRDLDHRFGRI